MLRHIGPVGLILLLACKFCAIFYHEATGLVNAIVNSRKFHLVFFISTLKADLAESHFNPQAEYPVAALRGHKLALGMPIYSGKILTKF
jgi:hypothetical protein